MGTAPRIRLGRPPRAGALTELRPRRDRQGEADNERMDHDSDLQNLPERSALQQRPTLTVIKKHSPESRQSVCVATSLEFQGFLVLAVRCGPVNIPQRSQSPLRQNRMDWTRVPFYDGGPQYHQNPCLVCHRTTLTARVAIPGHRCNAMLLIRSDDVHRKFAARYPRTALGVVVRSLVEGL